MGKTFNRITRRAGKLLGMKRKSPKPKAAAKRRRCQQPEALLHEACVAWLRERYPEVRFQAGMTGAMLTGGARQWHNLERKGASKGWPDLFVPRVTKYSAGLFVEFKATTQLTCEQSSWLEYLSSGGYTACVVRSVEEFKCVLDQYLG